MNLRFFLFGKAREKFYLLGYDEYLKRLSRFAKTSIVTFEEETLPSKPSEKEIKAALDKEADRVLRQIKEDEILFLVDIHAPLFSSARLAQEIQRMSERNGNFVLVIGSSYGLSDKLRKRADVSFSLSEMTFTHYMALLLTMEQVYRAMKINSGEAYDK